MNLKRLLITISLTAFLIFAPSFTSAEIVLPCSRGTAAMCGFNDVFTLINNLIKFFLTTVLLPLVIILTSYAGWLFMTSGGNQSKRTQAKGIFKNLVIGLAIFLLAWSVVYFVFKAFGIKSSNGLSNKKIDWSVGGSNLPQINTNSNSTNTNTNNAISNASTMSSYEASIVHFILNPAAARFTVTISPKAPYEMAIRMYCLDQTGEKKSEGESKIASGSSVTTITMTMQEETEYTCNLENIEGQIVLPDETDGKIITPRVTPVGQGFEFLNPIFSSEKISIRYRNASSLYSNSGFISCVDSKTNQTVISKTGFLMDNTKGSDLRYLNFDLPTGFSSKLEENLNINCSLFSYTIENKLIKENENKFSGIINSTKKTEKIDTKFAITEKQIGKDSITLIFNGSININPNLALSCYSNNSNHVFRTRATFDPTNILMMQRQNNPLVSPDSLLAPITLPVTWSGFGLRPGSLYSCNLEGETLEKVSEYEQQAIVGKSFLFAIETPLIPLPQPVLQSKLNYYVSVGVPRVVYVNYPYVKPVNILQSGPYLAESNFSQPIPDSIFVPVTNGLIVDNSQMSLVCSGIMGPAAGSSYSTLVSVSETQSANTTGIAQVYGSNAFGTGFSVPVTRTNRGGFMHSSAYACMIGFTVEGIPQLRSFIAAVPISIDPAEIGPVVLSVENINADKSYANFTIVASPRIENSVTYTCTNPAGNYTGESFWPPQSLGIRMPVSIPVMSNLPGLKPNSKYDCVLAGSTYQKERVEYRFSITTP